MTWSITDPADTEAIRQGASRIRELKTDLQTAMQVEHAFPGPDTANPKLYYTPPYGNTASRPPSSVDTAGRLYANTDTHSIQRDRGDGSNWDDITPELPAGAIMCYGGSAAPSGWLICDGSAISRVTYANLFTAIGTKHGVGNGSTTFNLPDCRGLFVRGVDGGAGRDPNAASRTQGGAGGNSGDNVGSIQPDATAVNGLSIIDPAHSHNFVGGGSARTTKHDLDVSFGAGAQISNGDAMDNALTGVSLDTSDSETRPANIYLLYIIKI